MTIQMHKQIPITEQDLGLWEGHIKAFVPEVEKPMLKWKGAIVPLDVLRQGLAFCKYGWLEWRSEVQLRLYYNTNTKVWRFEAFPQWVGTGMTTKEIDCDSVVTDQEHKDMRAMILQELENGGFAANGTAHSHGATAAFQSSTDYKDEIEQPGLHLTYGKVTSDTCEIHGRVSFRGIMYPVHFSQWFNVPDDIDEDTLEWAISLSDDKEMLKQEFPARWLKCCHKKPVVKYTPPPYNYRYNWNPRNHQHTKNVQAGFHSDWDSMYEENDVWDYETKSWKSKANDPVTSEDIRSVIQECMISLTLSQEEILAPLFEEHAKKLLNTEDLDKVDDVTPYELEVLCEQLRELAEQFAGAVSELEDVFAALLDDTTLEIDTEKLLESAFIEEEEDANQMLLEELKEE